MDTRTPLTEHDTDTPALARFRRVLATYQARTAVTPAACLHYAGAVRAAAYNLAVTPDGESALVALLNSPAAAGDSYLADALRSALREVGSDRALSETVTRMRT